MKCREIKETKKSGLLETREGTYYIPVTPASTHIFPLFNYWLPIEEVNISDLKTIVLACIPAIFNPVYRTLANQLHKLFYSCSQTWKLDANQVIHLANKAN